MARKTHSSDLTAHVGYWLRFVSNHVSQAFARKVEEHGVTVAEWVLMRQLLDAESAAPSRLAEQMGMTRGAITKIADRLIEKALVVRTANPDDGRAQTLRLTSAGRALVPTLARLADENDAEFFAHLLVDERTVLMETLRGIVKRKGFVSIPVE